MVRRINLVPQSARQRTVTNVGLLVLLAVSIVVVFALGFGYYLLNSNLSDRESELADVQQQTALLQGQLTALQQYEQLQSERASTEAVVQGVYASRTLVSGILDAVSRVVPENAWFQGLALTASDPAASSTGKSQTASPTAQRDNKLAVEGRTYSFEDVAQVLVRLQLVPALSEVNLVSAGQSTGATDPAKNVKAFSIGAAVINTQPADTPLPMSQVEVDGS
jgi:Tfp pilus assembly protein PilN